MGDAVSSLAHHQSPHIQHRTPILSRFPHPRLVNTLVMVATVYVAPKVVRSVSPVVADGVKYKSASEYHPLAVINPSTLPPPSASHVVTCRIPRATKSIWTLFITSATFTTCFITVGE